MSTFNTTLHPTPFGFYDKYQLFQQDANNIVIYVLRTLGEDVLGVELTKPMIWSQLEAATWMFNGMMIEYQNKSNLSSLLGMPTGSIDANGNNTINISDMYVQQNLEFLKNLSAPYAGLVGFSQTEETYSGSITLAPGKQDYDLYTELVDNNGVALWAQQPTGGVTGIEVVEVYHNAPVQYMFNSNLASNFVAQGLPVESYIPDTRFYVLPLFEDVLRAGMLETAQRIRRSHFSYKISGRSIRIFPAPNLLNQYVNGKLWIRVRFARSPFPTLANTLVTSGSSYQVSGSGTGGAYQNDIVFGVNGPFNAPFGPLNYNSLNMWSRNWIAQMTLALCLILLGRVRGKFKSFPIPGAELSLNGDDLISSGKEDKEKLMTSLKETLDNLTYDKIAERDAARAENMVKQLAYVPMPPKYAIFIAALCIMLCM
jgi:hypothetical protein